MQNNKPAFARATVGKVKRGIWFSVEIFLFSFVFLSILLFRGSINIAEGFTIANIAGYAWSSNFGWISMNCNNTGTSGCGNYNYGVNINTAADGNQFNFDGYAWGSGAGWVSFKYDTTPPPDNWKFNSNCKSSFPCTSVNNCTACYNPDTGKIYGWARVVNLGNDGWINLATTTGAYPYQTSVDQTSASGTFSGFAYNGSNDNYKGLGWISFNCANPGLSGCGSSNYAVYLKGHHQPAPATLSAPNWHYTSACGSLALRASLQWSNPSYTTTYYRVIVNTSNSTTTGSMYDSGKRSGNVSSFAFQASGTNAIVDYNTHYYWFVKVWDDFGFVSPWRQFNTSAGDTLTDNASGNGANPKTFTTYAHEMPVVNFIYLPYKPLVNDVVTSTDASGYFSSSNKNGTPTTCDKSHCSWSWSGSNLLSNSTPTASSTGMVFKYGNSSIKLNVTDNDGYACTSTTNFFADLLPFWKEKQTQ